MQISVVVERVKGNGYRARSAEPVAISATGTTRDKALAKLREKIQAKLKNGAELVALDVTPSPHPLAQYAGMFKNDPDFEDVLKIMAENRKKMDKDPRVP